MKSPAEVALGLLTLAVLSSCAGGDRPRGVGGARHWVAVDLPVKIGRPYQAGGRWWTPADTRDLDEVGLATWYGADHQGARTASGEPFDRMRISAAHRTLPLPSYVEVTAIDTGRTILVRINDRGPFRPERVVDLSQAAARQLGIEGQGIARVRVRRVEPPESERALLRSGRPVGYRPIVGPAERARLARRLDVTTPAVSLTLPGSSTWYVQVAAVSDPARADALRIALSDLGAVQTVRAGDVWRIRLGPYRDHATATAMLAQLRSRGYQDARVAPSTPPDRPAVRNPDP